MDRWSESRGPRRLKDGDWSPPRPDSGSRATPQLAVTQGAGPESRKHKSRARGRRTTVPGDGLRCRGPSCARHPPGTRFAPWEGSSPPGAARPFPISSFQVSPQEERMRDHSSAQGPRRATAVQPHAACRRVRGSEVSASKHAGCQRGRMSATADSRLSLTSDLGQGQEWHVL